MTTTASSLSSILKARRAKLSAALKEKKLDGILTFDPSDCFYLTDFPSEGIFVLSTRSGHFVFSPGLLYGHVREHLRSASDVEVISESQLFGALKKCVSKHRFKTLAFDPEKLTVSLYEALQKMSVRWEAQPNLILRQRSIKDAEEIRRIQEACDVTSRAVSAIPKQFRRGQTEKELAQTLERRFFREGATKLAFDTIVAFDGHGSFPHHVLTDKKWDGSAPILIDSGAAYQGYCSDLTRTWGFGKISRKFRKVYEVVLAAQQAGIAAIREGVTAGEIDAVCRDFITKAGFGDFFIHSTGHGVGIDIHEAPRLGIGSKEVLKSGMVVTVEPGIYLPGELGVRIEDTLLVTEFGCKSLTNVPKFLE